MPHLNKQGKGFVACLVALLFSIYNSHAHGQDWELLECVDSKHAAFLNIETPQILLEQLGQADLLKHPLLNEIADHFDSDSGQRALEKLGFEWPKNLEDRIGDLSDQFPGKLNVLISVQRNGTLDYFISVKSTLPDSIALARTLVELMGMSKQVDSTSLEPDSTGIIELKLHAHSMYLSLHHGRCLVSSNKKKLIATHSALDGHKKPKRTFASNRKFLRGLAQSKNLKGELIANGFLDPTLIRRFSSPAVTGILESLGLPEITTISFDLRTADSDNHSDMPNFTLNCWIGTTLPRSEMFSTLLKPESELRLPTDLDLDEAMESLAIRCDPTTLLETARNQFDEKFGPGALADTFGLIEKSERFKQGFIERFIDSARGQLLFVTYENSRAPVQLIGLKNRDQAVDVLSELVNRPANARDTKKMSVDSFGITRWDWTNSQLEKYRSQVSRQFGLTDPEKISKIQPSSVAIRDQFAIQSDLSTIRSLRPDTALPAREIDYYRPTFEALKQHDRSLTAPILIWKTSPRYWKTSIGSFHWQLQRKYGNQMPLLNVSPDGTVLPTELSKDDASFLVDQIKLRILYAMCDKLGKVSCCGFGDEFGARLTIMFFDP